MARIVATLHARSASGKPHARQVHSERESVAKPPLKC
jgi:hypothetical protein